MILTSGRPSAITVEHRQKKLFETIPARRDTTEYSIGTTIRIYTVNIRKIFSIEIGAHVLQLV